METNIDVRRAHSRFSTKIDWLDSNHSFSFGPHYDPDNTHHGLLLVSNDDIIKPWSGFMTHPHKDMEIITWVLDGELEHKDSEGHRGIIYPGLAQRMSAGSGIWHSEMNASSSKPVHLVQMWVVPDRFRDKPGYEQLDVNKQLKKGGLIPIASGRGHNAAISIRQKDAVLWGGRLKKGETISLPNAAFVHFYVAKGSGELDKTGILNAGDAARLDQPEDMTFTASAETGAEVLIWEMASQLKAA